MTESFIDVPKIELHCHLEGAIRPATYFEIMRARKKPLQADTLEELLPYILFDERDARNLSDGLKKLKPLRYILTDPETLARICFEVFEDAALDGVKYLEVRFSSSHMLMQGMTPGDIAAGLEEGFRMARKSYDIGGCFIAGITRELPEMAEHVTNLAINNMHRGILGMDIFGDEKVPPENYKNLIGLGHDAGLQITIHAGESAGPENIHTAITQMHATRIGHGVHIVQDSEVMRLARDQGVLLEMCPTSNVCSGAIARLSDHPLKQVMEFGIPACVCSDDPQFFRTTLSTEYKVAEEVLGVPRGELATMTLKAVDWIFNKDEQSRLRGILDAG